MTTTINSIGTANPIQGTYGGTGVNNGTSTITVGGNFDITGGAYTFTGTLTNNTSVTFPTSGTLATTAAIPSFPLSLANGGTNANLTASNGGIFYSSATAGAILAGTATANQIVMSGSSTTPAWSTATYPASTTVNQLLYSSSSNVIGGLATANSGTLVTSGSGVPSIQTLTAGQILIGTTAGAPSATTLTPGTGISISSVSGAITITATASESNWVNQAVSTTMVVNTSYFANAGGLVTLTLPAVAAQGTEFAIAGVGAGGWKLAQAIGQQINFGNVTTTSGVTGYLASSNQFDTVLIVCTAANTQFSVLNSVGNLTYN